MFIQWKSIDSGEECNRSKRSLAVLGAIREVIWIVHTYPDPQQPKNKFFFLTSDLKWMGPE